MRFFLTFLAKLRPFCYGLKNIFPCTPLKVMTSQVVQGLCSSRACVPYGRLQADPIIIYIQLTISFLIGRKRKVNFRNQRLRRHLATGYAIIMSRTLKDTGDHVMYDRGVRFLRVIMSSSRALWCFPSVNKQKHDLQVYMLRSKLSVPLTVVTNFFFSFNV